MGAFPHVIFGTYEEFLIGYELELCEDSYKFTLNMASHAHLGSIRSLSVYKNMLASAGADEYVNVFNMVDRKEIAVLTPHEGTITSVHFAPDGSHLISGSQDGNISIFRCSDWRLMKAWKDAHKKPNGVVDMSIHPSGKLLLSIGADHIMRVWNMIKGRQAYAVNFGKKVSPGNTLNIVKWSSDGDYYAVAVGNMVEVYSTETASVVYVVRSDSKISCIDLSLPNIIAVGREDGKLEIHNYSCKEQLLEHKAHVTRMKCLKLLKTSKEESFFVSADSQGVVRLWHLKKLKKNHRLSQKAEVNADCRIVCMAIQDPRDLVKEEVEHNDDAAISNGIINSKETEVDEVNVSKARKRNSNISHINMADVKKRKRNSKGIENFADTGTFQEKSERSKAPQPKRKSFSTSHWDVT